MAQFKSYWQARQPREQALLLFAAAVIGGALLYALALEPAWRTRAEFIQQLPLLRQQLAQMQAWRAEATELQRAPEVTPALLTPAAIEAGLRRAGLTPSVLEVTADGCRVQFKAASFAAVLTWLDSLRSQQGLQVAEAHFTRQDSPGSVDAELRLSRSVL